MRVMIRGPWRKTPKMDDLYDLRSEAREGTESKGYGRRSYRRGLGRS